MGLCGSSMSAEEAAALKDEKQRSKALDKTLGADNDFDMSVSKLLLLGAGESGKSTLFKQMITIYGTGFNEQERKSYVSIIHNNVISSIQVLLGNTDKMLEKGVEGCEVQKPELFDSKNYVLQLKATEPLTPDIAQHITALWQDDGVQKTYENRAKFQLTDSAEYFFSKVDEVADPSYLPSEQDVLRSRVRTTGIVENEFKVDGNIFRMYDVGGQRNERKKWIHCFSEVTAVIFVAALSAYDQVLFEDETTNRMVEALTLFEEICNSRWFKKTSIILFLNKNDLFAEKIQKVSLNECFPDFEWENTYEAGCEFIRQKFESMKRDESKQVYTHITNATDTNNMRYVFNSVKDIVIRQSLAEGGLLS